MKRVVFVLVFALLILLIPTHIQTPVQKSYFYGYIESVVNAGSGTSGSNSSIRELNDGDVFRAISAVGGDEVTVWIRIPNVIGTVRVELKVWLESNASGTFHCIGAPAVHVWGVAYEPYDLKPYRRYANHTQYTGDVGGPEWISFIVWANGDMVIGLQSEYLGGTGIQEKICIDVARAVVVQQEKTAWVEDGVVHITPCVAGAGQESSATIQKYNSTHIVYTGNGYECGLQIQTPPGFRTKVTIVRGAQNTVGTIFNDTTGETYLYPNDDFPQTIEGYNFTMEWYADSSSQCIVYVETYLTDARKIPPIGGGGGESSDAVEQAQSVVNATAAAVVVWSVLGAVGLVLFRRR